MEWTILLQLLQTGSIVIGILVAMGTLRGRKDEQVVQMANIQKDIEYIKEKISGNDTLRENAQSAGISARSAHKRLDEHLRQDHGKVIPDQD